MVQIVPKKNEYLARNLRTNALAKIIHSNSVFQKEHLINSTQDISDSLVVFSAAAEFWNQSIRMPQVETLPAICWDFS